MKKIRSNFLVIALLSLGVTTLAGCGGFKGDHHYSDEWSHNDTSHWHACTDAGYEHLKKDEAAHTFNSVVTDPTYESGGYTTHTCTICDYSYRDNETGKLEHNYSSVWTRTETSHWHACTDAGYEDLRGDFGNHTFVWIVDKEATVYEDGSRHAECTACGYVGQSEVINATGTVDKLEFLYESSEIGFVAKAKSKDITGEVVVPKMYKGIPVTQIASYAFENCSGITSVILYESITLIGSGAFSDCTSLPSISIPSSVTSIGAAAFRNCTSLTSFVIPSGITEIDDYTFEGCSSLTSVTIPNSVTAIGMSAFNDCSSLETITIPSSVNSIGLYAFDGCKSFKTTNIRVSSIANYLNITGRDNLAKDTIVRLFDLNGSEITSVVIPDGVTSIGVSAFRGCSSLTSVTIPNTVTVIEEGAFARCSSLSSITIPSSVTSIGDAAFYDCSSLTYVQLSEGLTSIGLYAFEYCSSLGSVVIPDSVTFINNYAFSECPLTYVFIGSGIKMVGPSSFSSTKTNVEINFKVKSMKDYLSIEGRGIYQDVHLVDENGFEITNVVIPDGVTSIGDNAFRNCRYITSVSIPSSVTSIGNHAFENCKSLESIVIPDSVTSVGDFAFQSCDSLTSITVGSGVRSVGLCGLQIFGDSITANIRISSIKKYLSINGIEQIDFNNTHLLNEDGTEITNIVIPEGTTSIPAGAFYGCRYITSISIPDSVTSINGSAFEYCYSLASINIPDSVTSIGGNAFDHCEALESLVLGSGVTSIGDNAFDWCRALTSINIPDGVTSIGHRAFSGCKVLESIFIPSSVTFMGLAVFEGCAALYIYCGADSQPTGWNIDWDSGWRNLAREVVWGYTPE